MKLKKKHKSPIDPIIEENDESQAHFDPMYDSLSRFNVIALTVEAA